jgi:primase-polymerase (primpol)-like protein
MAAPNFDVIPEELKACPHWVLWKYEERESKITKVPYQVNGHKAKSTDPKTWCTFDAAKKALEFHVGDGIGFVFTRNSYSGIDLDHCRDKSTGLIDAWAIRYLELLKRTSNNPRFALDLYK